jgi:hypothetical protein
MDGTVIAILGYPVFPLIIEASSPAVNAPIKAAAAAGKDKSTSGIDLAKLDLRSGLERLAYSD